MLYFSLSPFAALPWNHLFSLLQLRAYRLVCLCVFCLYKLDYSQPCANVTMKWRISPQRCWVANTNECFAGSTWSSWPPRSSGSRRNSCKFSCVFSFFGFFFVFWWCFNHTNNSVGWDLFCFFFLFFFIISLSDSCLRPQGSQGPPGGVGSAGAVGEKVRGTTCFENSTSKCLKKYSIENSCFLKCT